MRTDVAVEQPIREYRRIEGTDEVEIVDRRRVKVDPALLPFFPNGQVPIGMTTASDSDVVQTNGLRMFFAKRSDLLSAKDKGIVTGKEWWYRTEYMRLSQNERRESLRTKRHRRTKAHRAHAR